MRLVVPISRRTASLVSRISGMRKPPPICTSSPREITTSFLVAVSCRTISTSAAAQLLVTIAASAPHSSARHCSTYAARLPRRPVVRSISRLVYPVLVGGAMGARPRLVWTTTPVPLMTGCSRESARSSKRCRMVSVMASASGMFSALRIAANSARMVFTTNGRGSGQSATASSSVSTPGMARSVGFVFAIS